mmetsp:Transcript_3435/g.6439  ORF Transcript_3435/g.6439 Transcript_3435/m.6439 type:complete len:350 (-) Transcript_3435:3454-4503(-)
MDNTSKVQHCEADHDPPRAFLAARRALSRAATGRMESWVFPLSPQLGPYPHSHVPPVEQVDFGNRWLWSRDPFALVNNAQRLQLQLLREILGDSEAVNPLLPIQDFYALYRWIQPVHRFFRASLQLTARILLPWLAQFDFVSCPHPSIDRATSEADVDNVISKTDHFFTYLLNYVKLQDERSRKAAVVALRGWTCPLFQYWNLQESSLSEAVCRASSRNEVMMMMTTMASDILSDARGVETLTLLTQWMDDTTRNEWISKHIVGMWRIRFPQRREEFLSDHQRDISLLVPRVRTIQLSNGRPVRRRTSMRRGFWTSDQARLRHQYSDRRTQSMGLQNVVVRWRRPTVSR